VLIYFRCVTLASPRLATELHFLLTREAFVSPRRNAHSPHNEPDTTIMSRLISRYGRDTLQAGDVGISARARASFYERSRIPSALLDALAADSPHRLFRARIGALIAKTGHPSGIINCRRLFHYKIWYK